MSTTINTAKLVSIPVKDHLMNQALRVKIVIAATGNISSLKIKEASL
ncbi:MAG: hypothetical protein J0M37_01150 [Ignavibacteria bacterium]|nr:hypothetical protein [Ignavibacteria bacterium]